MKQFHSGTSELDHQHGWAKLMFDSIFAATAASIMSSSNPSTGTSTPVGTPLTSSPALEGAPTAPIFLSASARMSREVARRGLYSRFFKGSIVPPSEVVEVEASQEVRVASEPGPSTPHFEGASWSQSVQVARDITRKRKEREKETKEERRARRAEKAKRKVAKSEKRTVKAGKNAAKVLSGSSEELPSAEESGRNERGGKKLELLA